MKSFVMIAGVAALLSACGAKEEACDPTGKRYMEMMRDGRPLTEKDKACVQAAVIKDAQELFEKSKKNLGRITPVETAPAPKWKDFGKQEKEN